MLHQQFGFDPSRLTEHASDQCYFCMSKLKIFGFRYNSREKIDYADVESVILARGRSEDYPTAPSENICEDKSKRPLTPSTTIFSEMESEFIPCSSGYKVHFIAQDMKGKDVRHLLGEYCWSIVRDSEAIYSLFRIKPNISIYIYGAWPRLPPRRVTVAWVINDMTKGRAEQTNNSLPNAMINQNQNYQNFTVDFSLKPQCFQEMYNSLFDSNP
ncbi:unnamed protein product [Brassicogethes aeneus]|uniref:Uncharacterized protein n=1 Tax=Brassicogethes aeneus TaxID=1431903 RepID=A0A9P0FIQ6_BRAAE|nr:unnamed protein product [Brassicogethes aeneus]